MGETASGVFPPLDKKLYDFDLAGHNKPSALELTHVRSRTPYQMAKWFQAVINTTSHLDDDRLQNDHIIKLFFNHGPDDLISLKIKIGVRGIIALTMEISHRSG